MGWAAVASARRGSFSSTNRGLIPGEHMESRLPPYPFDPNQEALVIGEQHAQEGEQVEDPRWLVLPFEGLYGNTICLGATGSAKTSSLAYPLTMQLIRIHANDPERKLGGLIMDPKGNYAHFVREQMARAGRADDFFEVALDGEVYTNVLGRPDLNAPALAGHFFDAIKNYQGEGNHDPFWRQEALDLATQAIRAIRLVQGREPTIRNIYRVGTSYEQFEPWIKEAQALAASARDRVRGGAAEPGDLGLIEEAESLAFWANEKLAKLDVKLRTSISATLNGACSMFDVPVVRRTFAPEPEDMKGRREFIGFREALQRGYVVSLRIPGTQYKSVSNVVRTLMKLNFFDAVLERLADLRPGERPRPCFFVADEYDQIVTQPADGEYYARSREACAINVVATQSYAVLVSRFKDQHAARALMANLRNQVWLGVNDTDSTEEASRCAVRSTANASPTAWRVDGPGIVVLDGRKAHGPSRGLERGLVHNGAPGATIPSRRVRQPAEGPCDHPRLRRQPPAAAVGHLPEAVLRRPGRKLVCRETASSRRRALGCREGRDASRTGGRMTTDHHVSGADRGRTCGAVPHHTLSSPSCKMLAGNRITVVVNRAAKAFVS